MKYSHLKVILLHRLYCIETLKMSSDTDTSGLPSGASGKEPICQCRRCKRCGFDP